MVGCRSTWVRPHIAVAVERSDGTWAGWVEPLADRISLDTARLRREQRHLDRQHRAGSPGCFNPDGTHNHGCQWKRSAAAKRTTTRVAELHRRRAGHRKTLHGALANRLFAHGADIACEKLDYVSWQKNFPRTVRDRAPGMLVETIRRKAESAGGDRLFEYSPNSTALSQTCLCGDRKKKPLNQRVHRCGCGITEHRDLFSAYLGLHVRRDADGLDRLDLEAANTGWLHRQDIDGCRGPAAASLNRRGRRHPSSPTRRSVARINARRKAKAAKRQSRSARTSTTNRPTARTHEQRDSRADRWNPSPSGREGCQVMTEVFDCADEGQRATGIASAISALKGGRLVVLPTDTVYGLGADAFDSAAVASLLSAKGRGRDMPVPVLVGSWHTIDGLVYTVPHAARELIRAFWPGALSLVVRQAPSLQWDLGDANGTVMLRMPLHAVAIELLREVGPMAVSSANISGRPAAVTVDDARRQLGDLVEVYLDAGPSAQQAASTIVDLTGAHPRILRTGPVSVDAVAEILAVDPVTLTD